MDQERDLRRVLIIYTGGTIGMKQGPNGYTPISGWMEEQLRSRYAFQDPHGPPRTTPPSKNGVRISYDIVEYDPLLDSANMETRHWVQIAQDIEDHYDEYNGFVVLHGTDTMVYTASALSFMLVNLRKTVVLTGSQIPMSELRNDAVNNLFGALTMAGLYEIPEVCLFFNNQLFRGNRCQKMDSSGLGAFSSSNLPPLAKMGVEIDVAWHLILPAPVRPLRLRLIEEQNVAAFRIFPAMSTSLLRQFLQPPLRGVVLETYGAGNIPATRSDLVKELQEAIARGVVIVNCTQCATGSVTAAYEAGSILPKIGVISGFDLTVEAALTKLAYILSQPDIGVEHIPRLMTRSLRGELTERTDLERFSFSEQRFVDTIAKVLSQGEELGLSDTVGESIFPVLACSAASRGDVEALERMIRSGFSVEQGDYDGRTALHLAAAEGQFDTVCFLLRMGADPNIIDRWGMGPIGDAIKNNHEDVVQILAEKGGRLDRAQGISMMYLAAKNGNLRLLKNLYLAGVEIHLCGEDGNNALDIAEKYEQVEIVRQLIKYGVRSKEG
jgi:lysophospholipase